MILVFGGTTEGRKAVEVLEEGGSPYYYSTKTGEQDTDSASMVLWMLKLCKPSAVRTISV